MLTNSQRDGLTLVNPWTKSGPVAQVMQSEVSRINPAMAQEWIAESGASMSLAAAAAAQGLMEVTPALQAEIDRFNPVTQEQHDHEQIEWLKAQNPYGMQKRRRFHQGSGHLRTGDLAPRAPDQIPLRHSSQMASCGQFEMDLRSE